jgi:Ca2+-binding RTX toxin-like protein
MTVKSCSPRAFVQPNAAAQAQAICGPSREKVGGAEVTFKDGNLVVKGTKKGDDIKLERVDENTLRLTVNGQSREYDNVKSADIRAGKGNDKIDVASNLGLERLNIDGGKGKDTIRNVASDCFIDGCNQSFAQFKNGHTTIRGGRGDDDIISDQQRAEIYGGKGADKIRVTADDVMVNAGRGNDDVQVDGDRAEIHGRRGADKIRVNGKDAKVFAGRGHDDVEVNGDNADINTGKGRGRDRVKVVGHDARVATRGGADRIEIVGDRSEVNSGRGGDDITIRGNGARVRTGLGKNKVTIDGLRNEVRSR